MRSELVSLPVGARRMRATTLPPTQRTRAVSNTASLYIQPRQDDNPSHCLLTQRTAHLIVSFQHLGDHFQSIVQQKQWKRFNSVRVQAFKESAKVGPSLRPMVRSASRTVVL